MKILYIYRFGILGGVCTQIYNRLGYLRGKADVELLFSNDYGASRLFEKTNKLYFAADNRYVEKIISENHYDLISVIDTPQVFPAIESAVPTAKLVIEVHTTTKNIKYLEELRSNENILERVNCLIVPSEYLKWQVAENFGFDGIKPIIVVPDCLDTKHFSVKNVSVDINKKVVLWVGKLDDHKNWKGFLEIARILKGGRDDCVFWMVGGSTAQEEIVRELVSTLDAYGLMESVKWLPYVDYNHMPGVYRIISKSGGCHLITSVDESFGMTMAEAISTGCPVIASSVGALPEVLNHFKSSVLYKYGDYEKAASLVLRHLNNPEKLHGECAEKSLFFRDCFSQDRVGKYYFDVLNAALDDADKQFIGEK